MRDLIVDLEAAELARPMLVVFDGYPIADLPVSAIDVTFAERSGPDAADDLIVELLDGHEAPESVLVVTSDAALRLRVTERGASVAGARSLLGRRG